ncbi:hypothetical protein HID58_055291 [Brassica napus]|uniref:(rape) hypothetical protein n=1 Tax=Brassica napus TaxID=3708 RepID=A0A816INA4_BRANA|nr:hypothetical protein HID58_055291 [Brassica napus]CAF1707964.1 unnamed protein product [Brassica napus]
MEIISHLRSTPVTPEFLHYLLQYILSALCIIFFLNGSSQNGLRRRIAFPARTAAIRWRYNRKNPAAKRIRQEVKEMQANPSDNFMSLPLEVTRPNGALGSVDYPKDE